MDFCRENNSQSVFALKREQNRLMFVVFTGMQQWPDNMLHWDKDCCPVKMTQDELAR